MENRKEKRQMKGFTLIEIMVVITIIGMIAAMVGIAVVKRLDEAKQQTAKAQIKTLENALDLYKIKHGRYPRTDEGLQVLVTEGLIKSKEVPKDPWGHDYVYIFPGEHNRDYFDLFSYGADGTEGGEGVNADIGNW